MAKQEIQIELLLGRQVLALNGRAIGRLEEIKVELRKGRCFVTEFHVGRYAMLDRLAALHIVRSMLNLVRLPKKAGGYRIAWNQLDLSVPTHPRLLCEINELQPLVD
jgi:sporulation protein YlmC with PRC-barrel domain